MKNILTIDVEEWFHGNDFDLPRDRWSGLESRVQRQTDGLLDLLETKGARATFFVLGCVAEAQPDLIRRIHAAGHEVASHSFYHDLVYRLTESQFEEQLRRSADVISSITGEPVRSFRAPSWSIGEQNMWALDVLLRCGFSVDSSIFPLRTWMYGVRNARLDIHTIRSNGAELTELPPAAIRTAGLTVPVAGGIFFRLLPYAVASRIIRSMNRRGRPAIVYLHPWELDPGHPRVPGIPARRTWYHYHGLSRAVSKYGRLLGDFEFQSIKQYMSTYKSRGCKD